MMELHNEERLCYKTVYDWLCVGYAITEDVVLCLTKALTVRRLEYLHNFTLGKIKWLKKRMWE